ncbi:MAG: hypothetical protein IKU86_12250 [Thermoguttaceae bacterium]|nr:hypothetical protein [Thermoguttaceae bacterium]
MALSIVSCQCNRGKRRVVWRDAKTRKSGVYFGDASIPFDAVRREIEAAASGKTNNETSDATEPVEVPKIVVVDETEVDDRAEKRRPRPQPKRSN